MFIGKPGDFSQSLAGIHVFHLCLGRIENGDNTVSISENDTFMNILDNGFETTYFFFQLPNSLVLCVFHLNSSLRLVYRKEYR